MQYPRNISNIDENTVNNNNNNNCSENNNNNGKAVDLNYIRGEKLNFIVYNNSNNN